MESKIKLENGVTLITHLSTPREKNVNFCLAVGVGHNHETKENLGISALFEKLLLFVLFPGHYLNHIPHILPHHLHINLNYLLSCPLAFHHRDNRFQ